MAIAAIEPSPPDVFLGDDRLYEVVDGLRLEKVMGAIEVDIMTLLGIYLGHFAMARHLGKVEVEMLFDFGDPNHPKRRPDVAFVSYERWPRGRKLPSENAWSVVPDLVVEVVSPTNSANEVEEKIVEYLRAGVRLVWVVYPTTARVYIHDGSSTVRVVSRDGELDGGDVLPDFRLRLADLFEPETA